MQHTVRDSPMFAAYFPGLNKTEFATVVRIVVVKRNKHNQLTTLPLCTPFICSLHQLLLPLATNRCIRVGYVRTADNTGRSIDRNDASNSRWGRAFLSLGILQPADNNALIGGPLDSLAIFSSRVAFNELLV